MNNCTAQRKLSREAFSVRNKCICQWLQYIDRQNMGNTSQSRIYKHTMLLLWCANVEACYVRSVVMFGYGLYLAPGLQVDLAPRTGAVPTVYWQWIDTRGSRYVILKVWCSHSLWSPPHKRSTKKTGNQRMKKFWMIFSLPNTTQQCWEKCAIHPTADSCLVFCMYFYFSETWVLQGSYIYEDKNDKVFWAYSTNAVAVPRTMRR